MMKPESNATITSACSEKTASTRGEFPGWVMSLVNRQGSRKLDLLQISVDINNRIFNRESKHEKINRIGCPLP